MTYEELYKKALRRLRIKDSDVQDYRPVCKLYIPEITKTMPNAIIIWFKTGEKIIFIDKKKGSNNV